MNKKLIEQLAKQAKDNKPFDCSILTKDQWLETFAKIIVEECAKIIEAQDVDPAFKHRMSWAMKEKFGVLHNCEQRSTIK